MELSERPPAGLQADDALERIRSYAAASRAENTWKAYRSDLEHFAQWCAGHGIAAPGPADPHVVAAYLTDYAGELATSTLARRLYALSAIHRLGGHPLPAESPEVQTVWSGIKRTHGTVPAKKAATLTTIIIQLVEVLGDRLEEMQIHGPFHRLGNGTRSWTGNSRPRGRAGGDGRGAAAPGPA